MPRLLSSIVALFLLAGCGSSSDTSYIFELTVRNTANPPTFETQSGQQAIVLFSQALGVVHSGQNPMYQIGAPASAGLELFAEDADASELINQLSEDPNVALTVLGIEPIEEEGQAGVLLPDTSYRIVFNVENTSAKLSLALQYLQSNDVIVGTSSEGIALFDETGAPIAQDISAQLQYLDAGTEVNQPPGDGADQPIGQEEVNIGAEEGGVVRPVDDGFTYPSLPATLQVSINPIDEVD